MRVINNDRGYNMDEVEFTIIDGEHKCELCMFYLFIDSGYGYCKRYPPIEEISKKHWWSEKEYKIHYQVVEWCRRACGEFYTIYDKSISWDGKFIAAMDR